MRVAVLSDLHLEFDRDQPAIRKLLRNRAMLAATPVDDDGHPLYGPDVSSLRAADLILAAGDIDVKCWAVPWLAAVAAYTGARVCYVAGNHEFYGGFRETVLADQPTTV